MNYIWLYPNLEKNLSIKAAKEILEKLSLMGKVVLLEQKAGEFLGRNDLVRERNDILNKAELIISLGGDGTLLGIARLVAEREIPILGVNLGRLGFLTEVEFPDIGIIPDKIFAGEYSIEERMMLSVTVNRRGRQVSKHVALNDVVITKGSLARLIHLQLYVDDEYVTTYPADGLIIATPTGSTAYSLSAGGPIVSPRLNNLTITPICPHSLFFRSIIVSQQETVKVVLNAEHQELFLTVDGQEGYSLQPEDEIFIQNAQYTTKLVKINDRNFYKVLRTKLRGSGIKEHESDLER